MINFSIPKGVFLIHLRDTGQIYAMKHAENSWEEVNRLAYDDMFVDNNFTPGFYFVDVYRDCPRGSAGGNRKGFISHQASKVHKFLKTYNQRG